MHCAIAERSASPVGTVIIGSSEGLRNPVLGPLRDPLRDPPAGGSPGGRPRPPRAPGGARAGPGPGRPGGRPGPPPGPPFWAHFGAILGPKDDLIVLQNPPFGGPPGVHFWAPRGGPPRGAKKCTFFWVFNNSPSRDSLGHFFGPPILGHFRGFPGGIWGIADWDSVYRVTWHTP